MWRCRTRQALASRGGWPDHENLARPQGRLGSSGSAHPRFIDYDAVDSFQSFAHLVAFFDAFNQHDKLKPLNAWKSGMGRAQRGYTE
jgi:hypothetical protein